MKLDKWLSCLTGVVLSVMVALGGIGCLVTAFHLGTADLTTVGLLCTVCAAIVCICFSVRYGGFVLMAGLALLGGYLAREGTVERELEALLYQITKFYDSGYGWGIVGWSGMPLDGHEVTGGLLLLAVLITMVVSWVVCHRRWAVFAILAGVLPLAACCVVTDTVPDVEYLLVLISGFVLLLLTQNVRRRSEREGVRLTALLLVPVLLASTLLFWLMPEDEYEIQANTLQQTVLSWFNGLPFVVQKPDGDLTVSIDGTVASEVNLANVGPKARLQYAVMDVVSDRSEVLYLRGQAFDVYDGKTWTISEAASGEDRYWPEINMADGGTVSIETRLTRQCLYAPYYPAQGQWKNGLVNGMLENKERIKTYSFQRLVPAKEGMHGTSLAVDDLLGQCMMLPADTLASAEAILEDILPARVYTYQKKLEIICNYVTESAQYDLKTGRMPSEETDFAIWFLEDSDTGYCIHFATAATVLLRAAGIPARYVTGYTAEVQAGVRTTVTADKAHAWVEYMDQERGCWMILDPTPADPDEEPAPTETVEPTEDTKPIETTEATETTEPVETTQPDETEATAEPTEDQGQVDRGGTTKKDVGWLWRLLAVLGCVLAAIAGITVQYGIRRRRWRKHMRTGPNNRRAIWRWRYVLRMAKLTGKELPEGLLELAEKAMFSQYTLTASELMEFDAWVEEARQSLCEKPWIKRTVIRLIWAVE